MTERVEKWNGLAIRWPRPPKTLKGAIYRIEELQQAIFWMKNDIEGKEHYGERLAQENRHLSNILEARWRENNARYGTIVCDCGLPTCTLAPTALLSEEAGASGSGSEPEIALQSEHIGGPSDSSAVGAGGNDV